MSVRWVDTDKGGGNYRSRLVAMEFRTGASAGDHALFGLLKPWADAGDGRLLLPGENPAGEVAAEAWAQAPSRAAQALERLEQ